MDPRAAGGSLTLRPRIVVGRRIDGHFKASLEGWIVAFIRLDAWLARGKETEKRESSRRNGEVREGCPPTCRGPLRLVGCVSRARAGDGCSSLEAAGKSYAKKEHHLRFEED